MLTHYVKQTLIALTTLNVLKINVSVKKDLTLKDLFALTMMNVVLKMQYVEKMQCVSMHQEVIFVNVLLDS